MINRKRVIKKLLCLSLALLLLFAGCESGSDPAVTPEPTPETKPQVTELSNVSYELHTLEEEGISLATLGTEPHAVTSAVTWVANELVLNAAETYGKPFYDVDVDLILTDGTVTYTIPGFWDGDFYQTANHDLMEKPNAATGEIAAHTGTLGSLKANAEYGYVWFDPVEGKTVEHGTFRTGADGKHEIGPKIDKDMVYYFYLIQ